MLGGEKRLTVAEVEKLGAISMKSYGKILRQFRAETAGPTGNDGSGNTGVLDEQLTARGLKQ